MLKFGKFQYDTRPDSEAYYGYYNPERLWNGWVQPLFTKSIAKKIVRDLRNGEFNYDANNDNIVFSYGDDYREHRHIQTAKGTDKHVGETGHTLYPIGQGWCWECIEDCDDTPKPFRVILIDESYDFIKSDKRLENLVFLTLGGSHAYGLNVEGSDVDLRGCALNSKEEILLGQDFEQVVSNTTDTTVYSFKKIIKLLRNCNPNVIELLGCKPEHYLFCSKIGRELLSNKDMFISQKCIKTFGGYANQQLYKLNQLCKRKLPQDELEQHLLKTLENASVTWREQFFELPEDGVRLYIDKAVNEAYDSEIFMDVNLHHYPLRDYKSLWQTMNNIVKEYNTIGSRNSKAIEHKKIGKHMMHLIRLYYMCFDILEKGEINTFREDERDLLLDIRKGKYLDENDMPTPEFFDLLQSFEKRMEYDKKSTSIPVVENNQRINDFVMSVNEKIIKNEL